MNVLTSHIVIAKLLISHCLTSGTPYQPESENLPCDPALVDWEKLFRVAGGHKLVPFVYQALLKIWSESELKKYIGPFREVYDLNRKRNLVLRKELIFLIQEFRKKGIEIISYKEPLSFSMCYSDIAVRQFKDIDFLVNAKDLDGVYSVLSTLDYQLEQPMRLFRNHSYERIAKEYSFIRKTSFITGEELLDPNGPDMIKRGCSIVEPHWKIASGHLAIDLPIEVIQERQIQKIYENILVNLPSIEDSLLIACVVGGKSEWRSLKLVADVAAIIESSPNLDWDICLRRSKKIKAHKMFLLGCLLAKKLALTNIPNHIYNIAVNDRAVNKIANDLMLNILDKSFVKRKDPRRFSYHMFILRDNLRERLRYFFAIFTTPCISDLNRLPLPNKAYFMYWFISPFTKYLVFPAAHNLHTIYKTKSARLISK